MQVLRYWLVAILLLNAQNLVADIGTCGQPSADFRTLAQIKRSLQTGRSEGLITEGIVVQTSFKKDHLQPYGGFWLGDGDDGLFVYSDRYQVKVGDKVRIAAKSKVYKSLPEISHVSALIQCEDKQIVPAPIELSLPVNKEKLLYLVGRQVHIRSALVRDFPGLNGQDFIKYGQLVIGSQLYHQGTEKYRYPQQQSLIEQLHKDALQDRLLLDDGSPATDLNMIRHPITAGYTNTSRIKIGDQLTDISGVVHRYNNTVFIVPTNYHWQPVKNDLPAQHSSTQLRVVSLNLENFFNGSFSGGSFSDVSSLKSSEGRFNSSRGARNKAEFELQQNKLINLLVQMNADIISLNEVENDGNDKHSAIHQLTTELTAVSGNGYAFIRTGSKLGSDEITNAQIYRADRVKAVGQPSVLDFGYQHRPLLLQQYSFGEKPVLLATVHLRSKAGRCPEDRAEHKYFGGCNSARSQAAEKIVQFLARLADIEHIPLILAGDFNSYSKEPPLQVFKKSGYQRLKNLQAEPYSEFSGYRYRGRFGHLDHVLINKAAAAKVSAFYSWPVNSVHSRLAGYQYGGKGLIRSSDHDPLILTLNFFDE